MRPCGKNRKLLVWLSLGELGPEPAAAIREHVKTCEGCRQYLAELSGSIETLPGCGAGGRKRSPGAVSSARGAGSQGDRP